MTDQLPRSNIHTPDLCTTRPSSVGRQTDVRRHDNENIARSLSDTKAAISARESMHSLSNMLERIDLVDGSTIERCAQHIAIVPYGKVFDPSFVWECPQCGDRVTLGWIERKRRCDYGQCSEE